MQNIKEINLVDLKKINGGWVGKTKNIPQSCKDGVVGGAIGGVVGGFIAGSCHRV